MKQFPSQCRARPAAPTFFVLALMLNAPFFKAVFAASTDIVKPLQTA